MKNPDETLKELAGKSADGILPEAESASEGFTKLYAIVARLRAEDGCPWDREQSPSSIRNNIIEEAYELVDAITEKDPDHVKEEIGDLLMLGTMTMYMYEQNSSFSAADVFNEAVDKLVRRHPHVFGDSDVATPEQVVLQWNEIKEGKEGRRKKDSILDDVPKHLPPLEKAYKLQKKAAKAGFDWPDSKGVWDKVDEEIGEVQEACEKDTRERLEEEMGDLLFTVVNLSRYHGIDPSLALQQANEKFSNRFHYVEKQLKQEGLVPDSAHVDRMEMLWNKAKQGNS
ncbi:MAG: nucleoside triphosphate pyrophosphohydrolase [Spirochaetaceae bacterium]|nr:nucleoside triphosphate pyrophosphohydrolase [Spirochaetaceae bacterium]